MKFTTSSRADNDRDRCCNMDGEKKDVVVVGGGLSGEFIDFSCVTNELEQDSECCVNCEFSEGFSEIRV